MLTTVAEKIRKGERSSEIISACDAGPNMASNRVFKLRKPLEGRKVCAIPGCPRPLEAGRPICIAHRTKAQHLGVQGETKPLPRNTRRPYIRAARTWITDQTRRTGTNGRYRLSRKPNETLASALRELSAFLEFHCTEPLRISDLGNRGITADRKARAIFRAIRQRFGSDLAAHAILATLIGVQLAIEIEGETQDPRYLRAMQCSALYSLCPTPPLRLPDGRTVKGYRKRPVLGGVHLFTTIDRLVTRRYVPFIFTKKTRERVLGLVLKTRYGASDWGQWKKTNTCK